MVLATTLLSVWHQTSDFPAIEDDRFWWIPQAYRVADVGLEWTPAGPLSPQLWQEPVRLSPHSHAFSLAASPAPPTSPPSPDEALEKSRGAEPERERLPPQWQGGLPDYGHPPLFFWYLGGWLKLLGPGMWTVHLALLLLGGLGLWGSVRLSRTLLQFTNFRTEIPDRQSLDSVFETSDLWWTFAGVWLLLQPALVAQLGRADLDLGLIAMTPWALEALIQRRLLLFMLFAGLATACKEPGVLLCAATLPWLLQGAWSQRLRFAAAGATPLLVLLGWALIHSVQAGWGLASPEHLPTSVSEAMWGWYCVARFVLWDDGRFWMLPLLLPTLLAVFPQSVWARLPGTERLRFGLDALHHGLGARQLRLAVQTLWIHLLVQVGFFGVVSFLAGDASRAGGAHWRYVLPAFLSMASLTALGGFSLVKALAKGWQSDRRSRFSPLWVAFPVGGWTAACVAALLHWHAEPVLGVERNLYAADLAIAHQQALPLLRDKLTRGIPVFVGTYAWTELCVPGLRAPGLDAVPCQFRAPGQSMTEGMVAVNGAASPNPAGLQWYGQPTLPSSIPDGAVLMESSHGEPLGRLAHELSLSLETEYHQGHAWVRILSVTGRKR